MSRKKETAENIKKEIVNIRRDDKQARVLVVLTSVLFAAIAALFYIVDWTLEWGLIKIVSFILVDIWLFFLPPAIRLSYLRNEGKTPGQWFTMGYHAGASGLWMPVLLAPLFGILYFLPRTYRKKDGESEETAEDSEEKEILKENPEENATQPEEKIAVENQVPVVTETGKPEAGIPVTVVPQEEKAKESAPVPSAQPEIKVEAVATKPTQPEVKVEVVAAPQVQPVQPEVKVVPISTSQEKTEAKAEEIKKEN